MSRIRVAIIGVGNLGKRHAQSAEKNRKVSEVLLIDPIFKNDEAIKEFKESNGMNSSKYHFHKEIKKYDKNLSINILIVATNSKIRKKVFATDYKISHFTVIFDK